MPPTLYLDVQAKAPADVTPDATCLCAFCARPVAFRVQAAASAASCPLCWLVRDLGRPRIDEEARLIWLPEADQRVVNILCREIHIELYKLEEPLPDDALLQLTGKESKRLCDARVSLAAREEAAASRLGSSKPSELAEALRQLPPSIRVRQSDLLAGLRLLPRGRFFAGDEDIYPTIVRAWKESSAVIPQATHKEVSA
jgi:hypothetical protein